MCQLVASNSKHLSACSSDGPRCTVLLLVLLRLIHASPVSQQSVASLSCPRVGWLLAGARRVIRLSVSRHPKGYFGLVHMAVSCRASRSSKRGSWQALDLHSIASTSLGGQSKSQGQSRSMEQRKKLYVLMEGACKALWQLLQFLVS